MAENDNTNVTGVFHSFMSPAGYTQRARADKTVCDLHVPPAADSIVGTCEYYYRPLHCEFREKVEKLPSFNEIVEWARSFDPWPDWDTTKRLLGKRDRLISPKCTDSDWSRHSNFMMRHIGCGHTPPSYYLSYGYYYCSNYGAYLKPTLSKAGSDWLDNARWQLQSNMEDGLHLNMIQDGIQMASKIEGNGSFSIPEVKRYQLELKDKIFKDFAFNTHPLAYLDAGLANLPMSDLFKIGGQPSVEEWGDGRTWDQARDSAKVVLPKKGGDMLDAISDAVNNALRRLIAK
ncbi:hypothetical protein [Paraburkholderia heleia]|uniref:hypothetical protein n=1 Tax=Paraburkholderia heleia TaxID=634127 RepID=UPI0005A9F308|nr:hypothetical protein [Paraburkholderia heleia]